MSFLIPETNKNTQIDNKLNEKECLAVEIEETTDLESSEYLPLKRTQKIESGLSISKTGVTSIE